jgi:ATP-dependent RNA helicase DeaD
MTFKDLALAPEIQQALDALGFTTPTEIQQRAIPLLLAPEKIDLHGQAQTGTGKTLAFGIPLLQKIDKNKRTVQGLIVAPTRELVTQITESLRKAARFTNIVIEPVYGGVSMTDQISAIRRGAQIIVGTPGRLNDHIRRKTLSLKELQILVLDEADIMLDMGFKEEVDIILEHCPKNRQIWLFSATVKPGINDIMKHHMKNTVSVRTASTGTTASSQTKQFYCIVQQKYRVEALCRFIDNTPEFYGFIFCPTKILTSEVAERLMRRGYHANSLHGDLSQVQRNRIIKKFKDKEFPILVATDVAARGIDVADITHVINYSLPEDLESYVHRIGRTGRAGKTGTAITFINPHDRRRIQMLERKFKMTIQPIEVPSTQSIAQRKMQEAVDYIKTLTSKDKASSPYHDQLQSMVDAYPAEEIKLALVAVLYEKFIKHLTKEGDIPSAPTGEMAQQDNLAELFVGMGLDDNIQKTDIIDFLVATNKIKKDQIHRIKLLRGHSFVVVPADLTDSLIEAVQSMPDANQRRIRISLTGEPVEQREGGHGHRPRREGGRRDRDEGGRNRRFGGRSRSFSRH